MRSPHKRLTRLRWAGIGVAVIVLAVLAILLQRPQAASATSNYLASARAQYPSMIGTPLDSCNLCHTNAPELNSYGAAFQAAGHNFKAIELIDSDGDGYSNLAEIRAGTLPGDRSSRPGAASTSAPTGAAAPAASHTLPVNTTGTRGRIVTGLAAAAARSTTPFSLPVTRSSQPIPSTNVSRTAAAAPSAGSRAYLPAALTAGSVPAGTYKIIGWNDLGMHCMNQNYANLVVLPPYNTLYAEVIRQDTYPQLVTSGVVVEYYIEGNTTSANKINFWQYAQKIFHLAAPLPPDTGLTGAKLAGKMIAQTGGYFKIEGVPLTPFLDSSPTVLNPYQIAHLTVKDAATGQVLAETRTVAPTSTEMDCASCHSDGQRNGISTGNVETNILTLHDQMNNTTLMNSRPVLCADCHASNALGKPGVTGVKNLSLAMHGRHSTAFPVPNTMDNTCYSCHPGKQTKCLRDIMYSAGKTCIDCHGDLKAVANPLRNPWVDEPKCGSCHESKYAENPGKRYRDSIGHGGLYCETCHGSPHAIVPSQQPNDNIQNIALQGDPGTLRDCHVCHGSQVPNGPGPHEN
ncbi:MAG TPA: hypothetical protein VGA61_20255 [Anaerolineae bacterium]